MDTNAIIPPPDGFVLQDSNPPSPPDGFILQDNNQSNMPDMSGIQKTAIKNLSVPNEGESQQPDFAEKLDKSMDIPITKALGNVDNDISFPTKLREHLIDAYKNRTATGPSDFMQSVLHTVVPIVSQATKSFEAAHEGVKEGAQFKPFGDGTLTQGMANAPFQAISSVFNALPHMAEATLYKGSGADVEALLEAAPMAHGIPNVEMQDLVGKKMNIPPETVTHDDIAQAIRMGFENKEPKAKDFPDTAIIMLGPENEVSGTETLHNIYKETGISPDKVFSDAQSDKKIAMDVKEGKIPTSYESLIERKQDVLTEENAKETLSPKEEKNLYADIKEKAESMSDSQRKLRLESLDKKMEAAIITPKEMAEREALSQSISKKQENNKILEKRDLSAEHQEIEENLGIPESMSASQLGKLDAKIQSIFSDKKQTEQFSDEQFSALEDYAKRVENARDNIKVQPIGRQVKNIISDESGEFSIPESVKEFGNDIKRDILNFATPMETGSERAMASAKDFANKQRWAQWNGARITNLLKEKYSSEELKAMWNALDEASIYAQRLESDGMTRSQAMEKTEADNIGHFRLPDDKREIIKALSDWAKHSWDEAKKLEMVDGEGLPFWTPRMAAVIGEDGVWESPKGDRPSVNVGKNLRTTSGNLKQRKYLTSEETEAAMKKAFGDDENEDAMLVRDIRAMPLALSRLQQAIAGKALINNIKEMSKESGADTVIGNPHEGYFTLDHPAFQKYRPKLELNSDGKWEIKKDAEGNDLFEKTPIYVSKEFEGPLKAILSQYSSSAYKALMELKGKSMALIMYSPLIHNAVEWGRALPAMPGKVATFRIYFEGNRAKNDPIQMQEAINAGLVPIGARYFNQDISSIVEEPNLTPGRSWTAKLLGGLVGEVSPKAGNSVKAAIDKMGDVWHNTLLWDRVADLQMGLYTNIRDSAIKDGMEPRAAQSYGAHIANRFAGALPMESMGNMARKMANIAMFSRSFTIGNLGVMKDMIKGLPSDVIAQLNRDVGEESAKQASKATQRKAIAAFALDIGLMYAGNSILQSAIDKLKRDKSNDQISQGYIDRYHKLMKKFDETPWDLLNIPNDLQTLSSTSTNEPGKENRILFSHDPNTGTAYYMRLPTGKIGEEFEGWITSPLDMARKKVSPLVSPLIDTYRNADYFGHPIYDKDARGISGSAENIGKVVKHFIEAQIPEESIKSTYNLLTNQSKNKPLDYMKAAGPLAGITFSKGYPGGPEAGILAAASKRHESEISASLPKIKEAIEGDDEDKAREIMDKLEMTPREQHSLINHYKNPASKVNSHNLQKFERIGTSEEKSLMDEQQGINP